VQFFQFFFALSLRRHAQATYHLCFCEGATPKPGKVSTTLEERVIRSRGGHGADDRGGLLTESEMGNARDYSRRKIFIIARSCGEDLFTVGDGWLCRGGSSRLIPKDWVLTGRLQERACEKTALNLQAVTAARVGYLKQAHRLDDLERLAPIHLGEAFYNEIVLIAQRRSIWTAIVVWVADANTEADVRQIYRRSAQVGNYIMRSCHPSSYTRGVRLRSGANSWVREPRMMAIRLRDTYAGAHGGARPGCAGCAARRRASQCLGQLPNCAQTRINHGRSAEQYQTTPS